MLSFFGCVLIVRCCWKKSSHWALVYASLMFYNWNIYIAKSLVESSVSNMSSMPIIMTSYSVDEHLSKGMRTKLGALP